MLKADELSGINNKGGIVKNESSEILTKSGTNEIEIFEFVIDGNLYGVNALKIREVTQFNPSKVTKVPQLPTGVLGTMLVREQIMNIVDLRTVLDLKITKKPEKCILIFCEFNHQVLGFVVDEIKGISRLNWGAIQAPNPILDTTTVTGIAILGDRQVAMLDLESLIYSLFGMEDEEIKSEAVDFPPNFKILVADDSPVFRKKISHLLDKMGATDVEVFGHGGELYERFAALRKQEQSVGLVLTDIEMPQVDGFTCCKKIKDMSPSTPVVIFSSLINEQIASKCKEVGANMSLNKDEFDRLGKIISEQFLGTAKAA